MRHANGRSRGREDLEVPAAVRYAVLERDGSCCRVCGRFVEHPALHHITYRSQGGQHVAENLITIGWLPGHECHVSVVHARPALWQPVLKEVVLHDGTTGRGLLRAYIAATGPT